MTFTAEQIITYIISLIAVTGFTEWLKTELQLKDFFAAVLAVVVSFLVSLFSELAYWSLNDIAINFEIIIQNMANIFTGAVLAYQLLLSDTSRFNLFKLLGVKGDADGEA